MMFHKERKTFRIRLRFHFPSFMSHVLIFCATPPGPRGALAQWSPMCLLECSGCW